MANIEQFEALEIIGKSEHFSRQLAQIENGVLTWADAKQKIYKMFFKQASRYKEIIKDFPENWLQASSNQFVAGYVFGNPARLNKYINNNQDLLNKDDKNLLNYFKANPWFYSLFRITESFPNNILKAQDCTSGDDFILYSKSIASLYKQGKNLFMTLLFNNGNCFQTYGIVHYYQGYSLQDFISFANLVSYHYKNSKNLSDSIKNKPLEYMLLDRFAELPVTLHKGEHVIFCAQSLKTESFNEEEYTENFSIEETDDVIKCSLKKYQGTMLFACIYYDKKKKNLLLHSLGLSRYKDLVKLLEDKYDFPPEPSWFFSVQMMTAVDKILGIQNPAFVYDKYFDQKSDIKEEKSPDLGPFNNLMQELTDYSNTGRNYSIQELATKHGVPMETALQLEGMLKDMDEKFKIDLDGGFDDIVPPPPSERKKLNEPLNRNSILSIQILSEEIIQSLGLGIESHNDFLRLIDDLYYKVWGLRDYTVLIYTLYLIGLKGNKFEKVDDYACEVLKLFWQVLLPSKSQIDISLFLKKYSDFCIQVLQKVSLIIMEEGPHFKMKASDLFYDFLSPPV